MSARKILTIGSGVTALMLSAAAQAAITFAPAVNYPTGSTIRVTNSSEIFHLGLLQGGVNSGAGFGYFSDFAEITEWLRATWERLDDADFPAFQPGPL